MLVGSIQTVGKPFVGGIDGIRREAFCWWDRRRFHIGNLVVEIVRPFVGASDLERREPFVGMSDGEIS